MVHLESTFSNSWKLLNEKQMVHITTICLSISTCLCTHQRYNKSRSCYQLIGFSGEPLSWPTFLAWWSRWKGSRTMRQTVLESPQQWEENSSAGQSGWVSLGTHYTVENRTCSLTAFLPLSTVAEGSTTCDFKWIYLAYAHKHLLTGPASFWGKLPGGMCDPRCLHTNRVICSPICWMGLVHLVTQTQAAATSASLQRGKETSQAFPCGRFHSDSIYATTL